MRPAATRDEESDQTRPAFGAEGSDAPPSAPGPETQGAPTEVEAPPLPLLQLRDGLSAVVDTEEGLAEVVARVAAGTGPVALDAERASGFRYSARAYLVQLRREGAGTALIDPIAFQDLRPLQEAIGDAEWILHAATQDLPCLREIGLEPTALFDTELAARLLGYPRVGLATLVETLEGRTMRKEHSAADWSRRPLPDPWLEYAALDVEVLLELRETIGAELTETGKDRWAQQEFDHLLGFEPAVRQDPWRRTSGIHKVKGRRPLAAVRALWEARDDLAFEQDTTAGRLLPDSALLVAANAMPTNKAALLGLSGFHGRGAARYAPHWLDAIREARDLPEGDLPPLASRSDGPPPPRAWTERDPVAAARLATARARVTALSEELDVPVENLLTPDYLRRVLWTPPATAPGASDEEVRDAVALALSALGARPWQVALTAPILAEAIAHPQVPETPR